MVWSFVYCPVLDQVRSSSESLVTLRAGIGSVAEVEVLVFQQDVLVTKSPVADVTLVGLLSHMGESHVTYQSVLVTELLVAEGTLKRSILIG